MGKPPLERQMEVERLLSPRSLPLDLLVYTPDEVRSLFFQGSPLIEEIMERGRILYMRKVTKVWITEAEDELDCAELLLLLSPGGRSYRLC